MFFTAKALVKVRLDIWNLLNWRLLSIKCPVNVLKGFVTSAYCIQLRHFVYLIDNEQR